MHSDAIVAATICSLEFQKECVRMCCLIPCSLVPGALLGNRCQRVLMMLILQAQVVVICVIASVAEAMGPKVLLAALLLHCEQSCAMYSCQFHLEIPRCTCVCDKMFQQTPST